MIITVLTILDDFVRISDEHMYILKNISISTDFAAENYTLMPICMNIDLPKLIVPKLLLPQVKNLIFTQN